MKISCLTDTNNETVYVLDLPTVCKGVFWKRRRYVVGNFLMEDDDSGSYFLPTCISPRHVVFSQRPRDSVVDPQSGTQPTDRTGCCHSNKKNKKKTRLSCVKNVTFPLSQASSSSALVCTAWTLFKGLSLRVPHGKFCCKLIH